MPEARGRTSISIFFEDYEELAERVKEENKRKDLKRELPATFATVVHGLLEAKNDPDPKEAC